MSRVRGHLGAEMVSAGLPSAREVKLRSLWRLRFRRRDRQPARHTDERS